MDILVTVIYFVLIYITSLLIAPKVKDKKCLVGLIILALLASFISPYITILIIFSIIISYITKIDGLDLSKK